MAAEEMETDYEVHGKSDLTLTSDSDLFYVHQTVVCAQSPVLRDKCATMKIAAAEPPSLLDRLVKTLSFWHHHKDSENLTIPITGDAVAVEALVHFFYHGDYLPDGYDADMDKFKMDTAFHGAVLGIAKAYGVEKLQVLSEGLLKRAGAKDCPSHQAEHDGVQGSTGGSQGSAGGSTVPAGGREIRMV